MRRSLTLTALGLLGSLLFAVPAQAGCFGGNGAGLFGRRARAYESYQGCYGSTLNYETMAGCNATAYTGTFYAAPGPRPVRRLLGGIFAPRRAAAYYTGPSNGATYYYPAPASAPMGSYGYYPGFNDGGYVHPGSPTFPATNCPNGVCPTPQTPGKATPQAPNVPPAPLPPSGPATGHHQHVGNGCPCGDKACTHGAGLCPCANPKCICAHVGGGRFPR